MLNPHDEGPGREVADRIMEKRREAEICNKEADYWEDLWKAGDWDRLKEIGVVHFVPEMEEEI